jgi:hypothetical protein
LALRLATPQVVFSFNSNLRGLAMAKKAKKAKKTAKKKKAKKSKKK